MADIIDLYFDWAGPNLLMAMATATVMWFLYTLPVLGGTSERNLGHMIIVIGAASVAVMLGSVLAALFAVPPADPDHALLNNKTLGLLSGVLAGTLIRQKAPAP